MNLESSFVRIYNGSPADGGTFAGTAFFIDEKTLLTATHVVQECAKGVYLQGLPDGSNVQLSAESIEPCPKLGHWTPDVALLHCSRPQQITSILPSQTPLKKSDAVVIHGFMDYTASLHSRPTAIAGHAGELDFWTMADGVHKGMSGGAVLNEQGLLVGVLCARHEKDKITSYCLPLTAIQEWLGDSFFTLFDTAKNHLNETEHQRAVEVFVGRENELSQLSQHLLSKTSNHVAITALHGMAGVGKSWLADHFYATHKAHFPGGYFRLTLNAENPASAELLIAELAELCEQSGSQKTLATALKNRLASPRTLVHIENIDTPEAVKSATQVCNQLNGCPIVLSGRVDNLGKANRCQQVSLKPFSVEDGLAQLAVELEWLDSAMPEKDDAKQLVKTLGGLPLAIHLASGYLSQGYTTSEFLTELKLTGYALPPADYSDDLLNRDEAKAVLHSTFSLSLKELAKQAKLYKIDAADQLIASLGVAPISGFGQSIAEALLDTPLTLSLLNIAQRLSLIDLTQATPRRWQLHPLLAAYLRHSITNLEEVETRLNHWFLQRLPEPSIDEINTGKDHRWHELNNEANAFSEWLSCLGIDTQYEVINSGLQYAIRNGPFPHWLIFCETMLSSTHHTKEQRLDIMFIAMQVALLNGNYEKSLKHAKEMSQLATLLGSKEHIVLAKDKIADIFEVHEDFNSALLIRKKEILPIYEELGDTRALAITKGKIADIIQIQGHNLDKVLHIRMREELPLYEKLGDERSIAITKGQIADILFQTGKTKETLRLHEEEILPKLEKLGEKRELLIRQINLAIYYLQLKQKTERANKLLRTAHQSAKEMQIPEVEQIQGIIDQLT